MSATAASATALVDAALKQLGRNRYLPEPEIRRLAKIAAILEAPDDLRYACFLELVPRVPTNYRARQLLSLVGRKRLGITADDAVRLLELVVTIATDGSDEEHTRASNAQAVLVPVTRQIEKTLETWSEEERARVAPIVDAALSATGDPKSAARLRTLVSGAEEPPLEVFSDDDSVGPLLRAVVDASAEGSEELGQLLKLLMSYPQSGKPSKKWEAAAEDARARLDDPAALASALLEAAVQAEDTEVEHTWQHERYTVATWATEAHEQILCAVAMFSAKLGEDAPLEQLRRLAAKAVVMIGDYGSPRSLRVANACARAIAQAGAQGSIRELLALERSVRHGSLLKEIRKAIDALAAEQGVTRGELLERAVETHDLDADGTRTVALTKGAAVVEVDTSSATLVYEDEEGKRKKTFPAAVKEADADTIAQLREDLKAMRKTIAGERVRLDGLLAEARAWQLDEWRALYLGHPLTGRLTRALIWRFGSDLVGIPGDEGVTTVEGATQKYPRSGDVRLWHPIDATRDEVRAWRAYLFEHEITQPIKQAFRELYVLTPAERETRVYSNRFAAHVFRQVQARALMKGRGWSPVALAWWDDGIDHGVARKVYEGFGVRAEFFYDPITDVEPGGGDMYPLVTSDQVRFFDPESGDELELADVPRLVFTEAMRDVDLFVGVTSIGADPEWLDKGHGRRFESYWREWGFGDLSASAEVRREVLEELVPRLAIADRLELEERYLVVRGSLRTYRIHLGSSNILMSPNDQYLCIVAARSAHASKVFLPFDDDPVLSMILSKAFLLAADDEIADATIVSQIR